MRAIADGSQRPIADSSVDIQLNRDLSSLQSLIDQFIEIQGISYIYISNEHGEFLAHTFAPGIPTEIAQSRSFLARQASSATWPESAISSRLGQPAILAGVAGAVHIGMDTGLIALKIQRAVGPPGLPDFLHLYQRCLFELAASCRLAAKRQVDWRRIPMPQDARGSEIGRLRTTSSWHPTTRSDSWLASFSISRWSRILTRQKTLRPQPACLIQPLGVQWARPSTASRFPAHRHRSAQRGTADLFWDGLCVPSFFQTLQVPAYGRTFTQTAISSTIVIFSLGLSAPWTGMPLPKNRSPTIGGGRQCDVFLQPFYWRNSSPSRQPEPVLPRLWRDRWGRDRAWLCHSGRDYGEMVSGPQRTGNRNCHHELRHRGISAQQGAGARSHALFHQRRAGTPVHLARRHILLHPDSVQSSPLRSTDRFGTQPGERCRKRGFLRNRTPSGIACSRPDSLLMWLVFFFNISAGISVISFQSPLLQDVWGLSDPSIEPATLVAYGATLIAVSSLCNGAGRLFWGLLSDRIGRIRVFRILLASQMVVFGILMTERNPWVFLGARLLHPALLRWGICHNAFVHCGCFRRQANVGHLRDCADSLGSGRDIRATLCREPQGQIPRSRRHLLLPDWSRDSLLWVHILLPVER